MGYLKKRYIIALIVVFGAGVVVLLFSPQAGIAKKVLRKEQSKSFYKKTEEKNRKNDQGAPKWPKKSNMGNAPKRSMAFQGEKPFQIEVNDEKNKLPVEQAKIYAGGKGLRCYLKCFNCLGCTNKRGLLNIKKEVIIDILRDKDLYAFKEGYIVKKINSEQLEDLDRKTIVCLTKGQSVKVVLMGPSGRHLEGIRVGASTSGLPLSNNKIDSQWLKENRLINGARSPIKIKETNKNGVAIFSGLPPKSSLCVSIFSNEYALQHHQPTSFTTDCKIIKIVLVPVYCCCFRVINGELCYVNFKAPSHLFQSCPFSLGRIRKTLGVGLKPVSQGKTQCLLVTPEYSSEGKLIHDVPSEIEWSLLLKEKGWVHTSVPVRRFHPKIKPILIDAAQWPFVSTMGSVSFTFLNPNGNAVPIAGTGIKIIVVPKRHNGKNRHYTKSFHLKIYGYNDIFHLPSGRYALNCPLFQEDFLAKAYPADVPMFEVSEGGCTDVVCTLKKNIVPFRLSLKHPSKEKRLKYGDVVIGVESDLVHRKKVNGIIYALPGHSPFYSRYVMGHGRQINKEIFYAIGGLSYYIRVTPPPASFLKKHQSTFIFYDNSKIQTLERVLESRKN